MTTEEVLKLLPYVYTKCPNCTGYGTLGYAKVTCPSCFGKGVLKIAVKDGKLLKSEEEKQTKQEEQK